MAQQSTNTTSISSLVSKAKAMIAQTQAQGTKSFAGSSYDTGSSGGQGGAVNAQGQIVGSGGQVTGQANPADRYSASATQAPAEAPGKIDTEPVQSLPQTPVNAPNQPQGGQMVPYAQAQANLKQGGLSGSALSGAESSLANSYRKAGMLANQTGMEAPANAGAGMAGAQQFLGATSAVPEPKSVLTDVVDTDSTFDSIFTSLDDFMSPMKQKTSLVEEYKKLSGSLGIESINAELIDAKRIIEGTEDDIRNEVTATGGFATESQVQALANARNKSLIKNYNALLESRDNAKQQLTTMMNLTVEDRKSAESEFDRKMGFMFKVAEFKQRATDNARSTYMSLINSGNADMLYGDTHQNSLIEKTLGLGTGGLKKLAAQATAKRNEKDYGFTNVDGVLYRTDSKTGSVVPMTTKPGSLPVDLSKVMNTQTGRPDPKAALAAVINQTGAKTDDKLKLTGAVISAGQALATGVKDGKFEGLGMGGLKPNRFVTDAGQSNRTFLSALEGTIEAWMTGASVSESQEKRIRENMIPGKYDSDAQIQRKTNALVNYMLSYASGSLSTQGVNWSPEPIDFFSNKAWSVAPAEESGYGTRVKESFSQGVSKMGSALNESQAGKNPISTGSKLASGFIETATSPLTAATQHLFKPVGKVLDTTSNKLADAYGENIQRGLHEGGITNAEKVLDTTVNLTTVADTVLGGRGVPKVATNISRAGSNVVTKGKNTFTKQAITPEEIEKIAVRDATPDFETLSPAKRGRYLDRVEEGGVVSGRSIKSNDLEIEAGKQLMKVPGYDVNATKLAKYQITKKEVQVMGKRLQENLDKEKVVVPKQEVRSGIQKVINAVPERSLLLQKSDPVMKNYFRVMDNALKGVDGKLGGILKLRKVLDDAYENARGKQSFGSDKISALDDVHKAARNYLTEYVIQRAQSVDVKSALREQWNLYRALDELQTMAEKESGSRLGRFVQKHPRTAKIIKGASQAVGIGQAVNTLSP